MQPVGVDDRMPRRFVNLHVLQTHAPGLVGYVLCGTSHVAAKGSVCRYRGNAQELFELIDEPLCIIVDVLDCLLHVIAMRAYVVECVVARSRLFALNTTVMGTPMNV